MIIPIVAADLTKWISFGACRVRSISGFNNQSADVYIQLHEASPRSAAAVLANGTVPKFKSLLAQQSNGFLYNFPGEGQDFAELTIAMSTTDTSLTAIGAAGGLDMNVTVDGPYLVANYPTLTIAGDLAGSDVNTLQVWAESAGPKTLMRVDALNGTAVQRYLVGYAVDSVAVTSKPQFILSMPGNATYNFCAGAGIPILEKTPSDQALHQGLTILQSTSTTPGTTSTAATKIRAMYV